MSPTRRILLAFHLPEALRDVLQGITDYARQRQCNWQVLCVSPDEFTANFAGRRADGAITAIRADARTLVARLVRSRTPVVNLLHDLAPRLPSVLSDDMAIGRVGAEYLIARGFGKLAFLGIDTRWSVARQCGFEQAVAAASLAAPATIEPLGVADFRFQSKVRAVAFLRRWLRTLPRGVAAMTACDFVSRTLASSAEAEGIDVPRDLAILGVDNFHTVCELSPVPLSSVAQDFVLMGFEAARVLDALIRDPRSATPKAVLIPPGRIHVRTSTDVLAFTDPAVVEAMAMIHAHAATGVNIKQLLRQIPISRKWLDHRFKSLVGRTVSQEIRRCRLQYVHDLLVDTDLPLRQIAMQSQFSCTENLIRCFRSAYGQPPQTYRLNAKNSRLGLTRK
jgi:LacI family transcriptional regulator